MITQSGNISVWRGLDTPPTIYHIWYKEDIIGNDLGEFRYNIITQEWEKISASDLENVVMFDKNDNIPLRENTKLLGLDSNENYQEIIGLKNAIVKEKLPNFEYGEIINLKGKKIVFENINLPVNLGDDMVHALFTSDLLGNSVNIYGDMYTGIKCVQVKNGEETSVIVYDGTNWLLTEVLIDIDSDLKVTVSQFYPVEKGNWDFNSVYFTDVVVGSDKLEVGSNNVHLNLKTNGELKNQISVDTPNGKEHLVYDIKNEEVTFIETPLEITSVFSQFGPADINLYADQNGTMYVSAYNSDIEKTQHHYLLKNTNIWKQLSYDYEYPIFNYMSNYVETEDYIVIRAYDSIHVVNKSTFEVYKIETPYSSNNIGLLDSNNLFLLSTDYTNYYCYEYNFNTRQLSSPINIDIDNNIYSVHKIINKENKLYIITDSSKKIYKFDIYTEELSIIDINDGLNHTFSDATVIDNRIYLHGKKGVSMSHSGLCYIDTQDVFHTTSIADEIIQWVYKLDTTYYTLGSSLLDSKGRVYSSNDGINFNVIGNPINDIYESRHVVSKSYLYILIDHPDIIRIDNNKNIDYISVANIMWYKFGVFTGSDIFIICTEQNTYNNVVIRSSVKEIKNIFGRTIEGWEPIEIDESKFVQRNEFDVAINNINVNLDNKADKTELENAVSNLTDALDNKVDKIEGKGLSTNDYTTIEKTIVNNVKNTAFITNPPEVYAGALSTGFRFSWRDFNGGSGFHSYDIPLVTTSTIGLMSHSDKNKLDGIPNTAEANILEGVQVNNVDLPINSKKVNINLTPYALTSTLNSELAKKQNQLVAGNSVTLTPVEGSDYLIKIDVDSATVELFKIVDSLPTTGLSNIIYLVPVQGGSVNNFNEYIWIDDKWEDLGHLAPGIDLSNYYTKAEVTALLSNKVNNSDFLAYQLAIGDQLTTINSHMVTAENNITQIIADLANTQGKLTAGPNITIVDNIISASDTITEVIDNLNSSSSEDALSANQGRILDGKITTINTNVSNLSNQLFTLDSGVVKLTGNQTISGTKTFNSFPITPSSSPTSNYQVANKLYVDNQISTVNSSISTLDSNSVKLTGNQTIAGIKTFSSSPSVPTPTNGSDAVNKTYVDNIGTRVSTTESEITAMKAQITALQNALSGYLPLTGGTLSGQLNVNAKIDCSSSIDAASGFFQQ